MGEHSAKAFTTDKLKKFEVSGRNGSSGNGDKGASADDYGRKAARTSDSSAFAAGGAAKAPSLGRAGRAGGGRVSRADGGKTRDISKVSDSGPKGYGDRPLLRAKGGRIGRQLGGALPPGGAPPPGMLARPPAGQLPGLPGLGRAKGGRIGRATGGQATATSEYTQAGRTMTNEDASGKDQFTGGNYPPSRARGGRTSLARGGKAKGKGKTVVNVIVGGHGDQQQPPAMPPHPMMPPPPPPPPPQAASGPRPPMMPPMMPPMGGPPGPPGPPGGGMPPGMPPPGMGRASGGRISEKFGAGSGRGRLEKTKRENSGKVMLPE
jgi:hypothetical protein